MWGQSNDARQPGIWHHGAVPGHLLLKNCVEDEPARPAIERALKDDSLL
jgi:hypothetical protein